MEFHYVTFGQLHIHNVNGKIFNKDCVAKIPAKDFAEGREKAVKYFGLKFCTSYQGKQWNVNNIHFFPRGYIELP